MKKILLAIDDGHFPEGAFRFARTINEMEAITLCGVFLPELDFSEDINYTSVFIPLIENYAASSIQQSLQTFQDLCDQYNIHHIEHHDMKEDALKVLRKESLFADLLLLSSEKFYADLLYGPGGFLGSALHQSACPLVAVPENAAFPESVILTYDGSASSVFAIKSFAALFPKLCELKTMLLYGNAHDAPLPDASGIQELVQQHFPNVTTTAINTIPEKYFSTWLNDIPNPIVVSGAYGRSLLSRIFRRSFVEDTLRAHQVPVFIAHR
ncbi:universal stress protein [Chitinophaga sp.]|uniref:universal stress protein n=1 Tax=Chitinophaga sp. TaxID=1869181 RepID=UPI0031DD183B